MYFSVHLKCEEPQYYGHTQIILGCGDEDREQTCNLFFSTPTKALYCVLLKKNNDLCNKRALSNPRKQGEKIFSHSGTQYLSAFPHA